MERVILENIKDAFYSYNNRECDASFFKKVIDEFNKDPFFDGIIKYEFKENTRKCLYVQVPSTTITADLDYYKKDILKYIEEWLYRYPTLKRDIYNFAYLHFLLHEIEHVRQNMYAICEKSEYDTINRLYKILSNEFLSLNWLRYLRYNIEGCFYSFERNANILSYEKMIKISDNFIHDEMAKTGYLFELLNGYNMKRGKLITPVDSTFKWIGYKEKFEITESIPLYARLAHGLQITEEEYKYIMDDSVFYRFDTRDYDKVKSRIKELEKK